MVFHRGAFLASSDEFETLRKVCLASDEQPGTTVGKNPVILISEEQKRWIEDAISVMRSRGVGYTK